MMLLGQRLKEQRNQRKLTQGQVARYAQVSQSTLSDLERGVILPKTLTALVNLASYFRCSVDYLLGLTEEPLPPLAVREAMATYDVKPITEELMQLMEVASQLPEGRQADLLRIAAGFLEAELVEAGRESMQGQIRRATGEEPDEPTIVGEE